MLKMQGPQCVMSVSAIARVTAGCQRRSRLADHLVHEPRFSPEGRVTVKPVVSGRGPSTDN